MKRIEKAVFLGSKIFGFEIFKTLYESNKGKVRFLKVGIRSDSS